MKKILLGLAAVTTVTAPLATVYVMNPNENPPITPDDSVDQVESDKTSVIEFVKTIFQGYTSNSEFIFPTFKEVQSHPQNQELSSDLNLFGISSAQVFELEERINNTDNLEYFGFTFDESPSTLTFNFTNDSINIPNPTWEEEESIDIDLSTIEKELGNLNLGSNTYLKPSNITNLASLTNSSQEDIDLTQFEISLHDHNFSLSDVLTVTSDQTTLLIVVKYNHDVINFEHTFEVHLPNTFESTSDLASHYLDNGITDIISNTKWNTTIDLENMTGRYSLEQLVTELDLPTQNFNELSLLLEISGWTFDFLDLKFDTGVLYPQASLSHPSIENPEILFFYIP